MIYNYIFYKIYMFTRRLGNFDVGFSTTLGLSLLLMINSIEILRIVGILDQDGWNQVGPYLVVFWITILIFNYVRFNRRNRYRDVIKRFKDESTRQKFLGSFVVTAYTLLTLLLIFIV